MADMKIYDNDASGNVVLRSLTEDDLKEIQSEWKQTLTHEPVFSLRKTGRKYIIRFDEDTEAMFKENEMECVFEIESENSETAIYDFLRQMGEEYWAGLEEDCHVWSFPVDDSTGERPRLYEFRDEFWEVPKPLEVNGIGFDFASSRCPNDPYPHMMHVTFADGRTDEPVCYICDLMPPVIAKEAISKALEEWKRKYDVRFSKDLQRRLSNSEHPEGGYVVRGMMKTTATDFVYDLLDEIYDAVEDGDVITLWSESDEDKPAYEFKLKTADDYIGYFEFEGRRLKGVEEYRPDHGMPAVMIYDGESLVSTICKVTVGNEAAEEISSDLKRMAEKKE